MRLGRLRARRNGDRLVLMLAVTRLLLALLAALAVTMTLLPGRTASAAGERNCCAMMKMLAPFNESQCQHDSPMQSNDKRCCAGCASCVAIMAPAATPFLYAASGDWTFAALSVTEHDRGERPPVPPPRWLRV